MNFNQYYTEGIFDVFKKEWTLDLSKDVVTFQELPRPDYFEINEYLHHLLNNKEEEHFLVGNDKGFKVDNFKTSTDINKNKIIDKNHILRATWDTVTAISVYDVIGINGGKGKIYTFMVTTSENKESKYYVAADRNFMTCTGLDRYSFFDTLKSKSKAKVSADEQEIKSKQSAIASAEEQKRTAEEEKSNYTNAYKEVDRKFYIDAINYHANKKGFADFIVTKISRPPENNVVELRKWADYYKVDYSNLPT